MTFDRGFGVYVWKELIYISTCCFETFMSDGFVENGVFIGTRTGRIKVFQCWLT